MRLLLLCLLFSGCSLIKPGSAYTAGMAIGFAYGQAKDKMSPEKKEALRIAYTALDDVIKEYEADQNKNVNVNLVVTVAKSIAKSKGVNGAVISLSGAVIKDTFARLKSRHKIDETDSKMIYLILKDFRQGIDDALKDSKPD